MQLDDRLEVFDFFANGYRGPRSFPWECSTSQRNMLTHYNMHESRSDEPEADPPTALERLPLPFVVHDDLVEPFPSFMVIRVIFDRPVEPDMIAVLTQVMDEWFAANAAVAQAMGELEPEGEALQTGDQWWRRDIHDKMNKGSAALCERCRLQQDAPKPLPRLSKAA